MQGQQTNSFARWLGTAGLVLTALFAARIIWQNFDNQLLRYAGAPDPACEMNYCDTALFWMAGTLSRAGDITSIYNADAFMRATARTFPGQRHYLPFIYPPPILLPAGLLSLAGLRPAYYTAAAGLTSASCWLFRKAGLSWFIIMLGLLSPAALWAIYLGQLGVLGSAILLAGLAGLPSRPARSGVLLSLLCCKPQYALLVPIILVAGRYWRGLGGFAVGLGVIVAASCVWPGLQAWQSFVWTGEAVERVLLQAPFGPGYEFHGASVFWMMRSLGAELPFAYAIQIITALLSASLAWRLWSHQDHRHLPLALCLILLVTPYGFTDDMVGYSIAAAMLLRRDRMPRNAALALLWLAPGFTGHLASVTGVLITPLLVLAMIAIGWITAASPVINVHPCELVQS